MNTISSLFEWIANTIGADPSTLKTTTKTLVGGINGAWEIVYPVGSYYETSDTSFNPNTSWGGTWTLETEGLVHISGSVGGTYTVNGAPTDTKDGGEATHTLTVNEMPSHGHISHNRAFLYWVSSSGGNGVTFNSSNGWKYNENFSDAFVNAGGGQAHNNMQPYIVVNRWHRTA